MTARLDLTGIYCADETEYQDQLGFSGIYLTTSGELVCLFCASNRAKAGETGLRCVMDAGPGPKFSATRSGFEGEGEPLTERESVALLAQHGAKLTGKYYDAETGEPVSLADVERAFRQELGAVMTTAMIPDPAGHDPAWYDAIADRYNRHGTADILLSGANYDIAFGNVCDLAIQMLWAESYDTEPTDPDLHTSDAARAFAWAVFVAAGINRMAREEEDGPVMPKTISHETKAEVRSSLINALADHLIAARLLEAERDDPNVTISLPYDAAWRLAQRLDRAPGTGMA